MANLEKRLQDLDKVRAKGTVTEEEYQAQRAAIISDPAALEQKSRAGGILRWGLAGCLIMLAAVGGIVILLIVLLAIALSGGSSSLSDLDDAHTGFAVGSSATVETAGDVKNKVTIDQITDPAISSNEFEQPQPGYHFMTVAITIENVGERETTGVDVKLRGKDGTEYSQDFLSGVGATDLNTLQGLTSGGRTNAVLAFEVKDGTAVQWLKFDPNPFANGDIYFDAQ